MTKDDFPEFSVEPGHHEAIPNQRFENPKQNMETAFAGLRDKAHKKGRYFQPIEVSYGGYQDKESILHYNILTQDQFEEKIKQHDPNIDTIF